MIAYIVKGLDGETFEFFAFFLLSLPQDSWEREKGKRKPRGRQGHQNNLSVSSVLQNKASMFIIRVTVIWICSTWYQPIRTMSDNVCPDWQESHCSIPQSQPPPTPSQIKRMIAFDIKQSSSPFEPQCSLLPPNPHRTVDTITTESADEK